MKKIIIAAAVILTTGVLSSQIKVNSKVQSIQTTNAFVSMDKKELASGD